MFAKTRSHLVEQNKKGVTALLSNMNRAIQRKTNMQLQTYLNKLLESLGQAYQEEQFENYDARQVLEDIEELRSIRMAADWVE